MPELSGLPELSGPPVPGELVVRADQVAWTDDGQVELSEGPDHQPSRRSSPSPA